MLASSRPQIIATALGILVAASPWSEAASPDPPQSQQSGTPNQDVTPTSTPGPAQPPAWRFGAFGDVAYAHDFNDPSNHLFRSRGTAFHVNELDLNMAGAYLRKAPTEQARFGVEATLHAGKDDEVFGFSATAPNIGGYRWLRHLGPTNASYLAPVGKGLTLQGGIFGSLIGCDSLYAKDNFAYTRSWSADFTPYLMLGVNVSYPFSERLTGTFAIVNGYWHLAHANDVPSVGAQLTYRPTSHTTLKQTVLYGPHQSNTSLHLWRVLSDSIAEWKGDRVTGTFEYQVASEQVDSSTGPRAWWMSAQLPVRWNFHGRWNAAVRPEIAWDSSGRWTLHRQTVKAFTTTLEHRIPHRESTVILRLEHRYDHSGGSEGGFFKGREVEPGVVGLTPGQHLLIFGLIVSFDGS